MFHQESPLSKIPMYLSISSGRKVGVIPRLDGENRQKPFLQPLADPGDGAMRASPDASTHDEDVTGGRRNTLRKSVRILAPNLLVLFSRT